MTEVFTRLAVVVLCATPPAVLAADRADPAPRKNEAPVVVNSQTQVLTQEPAVAVITNNGVEAYAQALEGIRELLPNVQVWDARDEGRLRENLTRKAPALAIALGSGAAAALGRVAPHE